VVSELQQHALPCCASIVQVGAKASPATQERILGAHFFSPAHVMPLLEIVRTPKTGKQVSQ
jgi:3-hydroxyacyl-CoA dehydrogenase